MAPASSQFLATCMPALRSATSSTQMLVGALFEMCWHLVPVTAILFAIFSSHFFPEALEGSKSPSRGPPLPCPAPRPAVADGVVAATAPLGAAGGRNML